MVARIGILGGSGFLKGAALDDVESNRVETERGEVTAFLGAGFAFVLRHGFEGYFPPHRIPHHAHVLAFEKLGITRVAGLNSVGSLDAAIVPGTAIVPDDYLSFHAPPTFVEDERLHIVPTFDEDLRRLLVASARATDGPVRDGGVYVETRGPRFETRAEIRLLADYGDVVGMTGASEATLFQERGIAYGILALVDNLANGVGAKPLTFEDYERQLAKNGERSRLILTELIRRSMEIDS